PQPRPRPRRPAAPRRRRRPPSAARARPAPPRPARPAPPGGGAPSRTPPSPTAPRAEEHLDAEVVLLDELVLPQLLRASPLELDAPVDDDVAAIGDLGRLIEVLLGHQHGQAIALFQLADLRDHTGDQNRRQP